MQIKFYTNKADWNGQTPLKHTLRAIFFDGDTTLATELAENYTARLYYHDGQLYEKSPLNAMYGKTIPDNTYIIIDGTHTRGSGEQNVIFVTKADFEAKYDEIPAPPAGVL